jgi:hypothetical protein
MTAKVLFDVQAAFIPNGHAGRPRVAVLRCFALRTPCAITLRMTSSSMRFFSRVLFA